MNYETAILDAMATTSTMIPGIGVVNMKGTYSTQPASLLQYPALFLVGWSSSREAAKPEVITRMNLELMLVVKDNDDPATALSAFKYAVWSKYSDHRVLGLTYVIDIELDSYNLSFSDETMFAPPMGMARMNLTIKYDGTWSDL